MKVSEVNILCSNRLYLSLGNYTNPFNIIYVYFENFMKAMLDSQIKEKKNVLRDLNHDRSFKNCRLVFYCIY